MYKKMSCPFLKELYKIKYFEDKGKIPLKFEVGLAWYTVLMLSLVTFICLQMYVKLLTFEHIFLSF